MIHFQTLYDHAAKRKGGVLPLEQLLTTSLSPDQLALISDDRWLSTMSQCVFNAGFNWKVVAQKWPGFEEAFAGFNPLRWMHMSEDDIDTLAKDTRIIRYRTKIISVRDNATLLCDLAQEYGTAATFFAEWPDNKYTELLILLKKRGSRLGGRSAQYFLRFMGKDSFILSRDVVTALIREDVVTCEPKSLRDLKATQDAFNQWHDESGRSLTHISQVLAYTVGA